MAIITNQEYDAAMRKVVGRRLRHARSAAGIGLEEARHAVRHKGCTQLSLAEGGKRIPPLVTLCQLADKYGVTLDYLAGRTDDPLADPVENAFGVLVHSVEMNVGGAFKMFARAVADMCAATASSDRQARADAESFSAMSLSLAASFDFFVRANPTFEDDMRGGARLQTIIGKLHDQARQVVQRVESEKKNRSIKQLISDQEIEHILKSRSPPCERQLSLPID